MFTKQSKEQNNEYLSEIHLPKIYILPKEKKKKNINFIQNVMGKKKKERRIKRIILILILLFVVCELDDILTKRQEKETSTKEETNSMQ